MIYIQDHIVSYQVFMVHQTKQRQIFQYTELITINRAAEVCMLAY